VSKGTKGLASSDANSATASTFTEQPPLLPMKRPSSLRTTDEGTLEQVSGQLSLAGDNIPPFSS
jgi:hypothetical protein